MRKPFLTILIFLSGMLAFSQQSLQPEELARYKGLQSSFPNQPDKVKLDATINSEYREVNPLIAPDDRILYFVRENHPRNMGSANRPDIWAAYRRTDGQWARAVNLGGPANDRNENRLTGLNSKGNQLCISNFDEKKNWINLVRSMQEGRAWSLPKQIIVDRDSMIGQAEEFNISLDANILLFTAKAHNSDHKDIFFSRLGKNNSWSYPVNLGPAINTKGTERAPYLAADGKTLYFSANSRDDSYGGFDLYVSRREDESWTSWSIPQNLGSSINTDLDEYGCSIPASGDYIYYASGNTANTDIYRSFLDDDLRPGAVILLSGKILNGETNETVSIKPSVKSFNEEKNDSSPVVSKDGTYHMLLPQGTDIGLYAEKEGYFPVSVSMELSDDGIEELDQDATGMMAHTQEGIIYSYSGRKVEKLQLRLIALSDEIKEIERERKKANEFFLKEKEDRGLTRYGSYRSDPELDALRHRYQEMLRQKSNSDSRQSSPDPADKEPEKTTDSQVPPDLLREADEELIALKRKYNHFYYGDETKAGRLVNPKESHGLSNSKEQDNFQNLETEVLRQLKIELQFEVMGELLEELIDPELLKAQKAMISSDRKLMTRELKRKLKAHLKWIIAEREQTFLRDRETIEQEDSPLKKELMKVLTPEVKSELKEQLADQVRADISRELNYQLKKDSLQRLSIELQANKREFRDEQKRGLSDSSDLVTERVIRENVELEFEEVEKNIVLLPLNEGQIIPLNNVFFEANTLVIKRASYNELERMLNFLKKYPNLYIEIRGHTNGWVSTEFALSISNGRAEAIRDYFIANGIVAERLEYRGFGNSRPLTSNATLAGRKKNQRIDFKILQYSKESN